MEKSNSNHYKFSIILPAYNEEKAIGKVIDDVRISLDNSKYRNSYEILVVDDCSSDKTAEIATSKNVEVIRRKINGGSGASRKTGILAAKGEVIVMLDADDTYTASDIPVMFDYFPDYDQVNGARDSEQGTLKFLRLPMKLILRKLASYLSRTKIPDLNTGLKAFKKEIMLKYLWVIPDGFSCVTTMTLAFLCNGHKVKYIPTKYKKRLGNSKFHPIKDTSKYLQTIIRIILYFNPLKIFSSLSFILFVSAIVVFLYSYFFREKILDITILILLITAIQVLGMGMIAELIVKSKNANN
ncbi:MAG: glycosyltransferase family 2 protein [Candidatus Paceibacter sp.]|nr:glycosyltransferase family 2 protein [Candidatus Paceibacter sp.]